MESLLTPIRCLLILIHAPVEKWIPPAPNQIKINFDTAIRDDFSAQAGVCRSSDGTIIHIASLISPPCSPNMGEALAVQLTTLVAHSLSLDRFILEGDSLVIIQTLNSPLSDQDWRIAPVIMSSLHNILSDSLQEAKKINRSVNFCTHSITRQAAVRSHFDNIPISISFSSLDGRLDPSLSSL